MSICNMVGFYFGVVSLNNIDRFIYNDKILFYINDNTNDKTPN